jgi:hypothetical protein
MPTVQVTAHGGGGGRNHAAAPEDAVALAVN